MEKYLFAQLVAESGSFFDQLKNYQMLIVAIFAAAGFIYVIKWGVGSNALNIKHLSEKINLEILVLKEKIKELDNVNFKEEERGGETYKLLSKLSVDISILVERHKSIDRELIGIKGDMEKYTKQMTELYDNLRNKVGDVNTRISILEAQVGRESLHK